MIGPVDAPSQPTPRLLDGRFILFHRLVIAHLQQSLNLMPFGQSFRCFRQSIHLLETLLVFATWMPHRWQLRLGPQAVSVYVIGQISLTNLTFGPG
ncbi:hypothetical protein CMK14_03335 [Candidatus Poribacteria bacterium]|nr:hypothetical protein [Candidatus Poribacteria bacterium]